MIEPSPEAKALVRAILELRCMERAILNEHPEGWPQRDDEISDGDVESMVGAVDAVQAAGIAHEKAKSENEELRRQYEEDFEHDEAFEERDGEDS